jgi:hypothetical protein
LKNFSKCFDGRKDLLSALLEFEGFSELFGICWIENVHEFVLNPFIDI